MTRILILLLLLLVPNLQGADANADSLARRIYLDLFNRAPEVAEYEEAVKLINERKYELLVNKMMNDPEYSMTLASKVVNHYAPPKEIRTHNFLSYKILEDHVRNNYLGRKTDFRTFVNDMMRARGIAAQNPMVLFYSMDETKELMTGRFSAQVLGVPMKCAQCHDHKIHPDIVHDQFWSMSTFFMGMDKKIIGDIQQLKKLEGVMAKVDDKKAKDSLYFDRGEAEKINQWIGLEKQEKNIYSALNEMQTYGQSMGHGMSRYAIDEYNLDDEDKVMLKAPQLFIGEYKKNLKGLKVDYELDGEKFTSTASHFKRDRKLSENVRPRDSFSQWIAWKEPLYMSRAVANWVTNWLMGRGWIMPAYDTYKVEGPNAVQLDRYARTFMNSRFNIHVLVKSILMSPTYRMANSIKNDEEKFTFFKARRLRHLSGEQIVNSLNRTPKQILADTDSANGGGMKKLYKIAVYKNDLVEKIFPVSLDDTEASYRGTLTQALKLSTDKDFLNYTNKLAEQSYNRFRRHTVEQFLDYIFVKLYTRKPTKPEIAFFKAKLNFSKSYRSSGIFETVWTLINSPEMRLY